MADSSERDLAKLVAEAGYDDQFPTAQMLRKAQELVEKVPNPSSHLPFPPLTKRKDIFNQSDMKKFYDHVAEIPTRIYTRSIDDLVSYLIEPVTDEVSAMWLLFRWLSTVRVDEWKHFDGAPSGSPADHLNMLKEGKTTHANVLSFLCKSANIPHNAVRGFVKTHLYEPGSDVSNVTANHCWSAVYVNASWRLVDVHWASNPTSSGSGNKHADFYFLTDPEHLIYSHFPENPTWQLLARPLSGKEFHDMAFLKQAFFEHSMKVKSQPKCIIESKKGKVKIEIGTPKGSWNFSYNLHVLSASKRYPNIDFNRYVFADHSSEHKVARVVIKFPDTGRYKLDIFCQDSAIQTDIYQEICTYIINCDKKREDCKKIPKMGMKMYGPNSLTSYLGMIPVSSSGKIKSYDGEIEVRFRLDGKGKDLQFVHKLVDKDGDERYNQYLLHTVENGEVIFNARLPDKGYYGLDIFAKRSSDEGSFPCVCSYLIACKEKHPDAEAYTKISNGRLGPRELFSTLGLETSNGQSAIMKASESGTLELSFKTSQKLTLLPKLYRKKEEMSEYIMIQTSDGDVTFNILFPKSGIYQFMLFAKKASASGSCSEIYAGLIEADWIKNPCFPFPEISGRWSQRYQLKEPLSRYLPANEVTKFSAHIPDAVSVVVFAGDGQTTLKKGSDDYWEGNVNIAGQGSDTCITAEFYDSSQGSLMELLNYKVKSSRGLKDMREESENNSEEAEERREKRKKANQKKDEAVASRGIRDIQTEDDYEEVSTYQPPSTTDDDLSEMDDALKTYLETKE